MIKIINAKLADGSLVDVEIQNGLISKVSKASGSKSGEVIDATGKMLLPGLVDLHTHLREPGREDAETIEIQRGYTNENQGWAATYEDYVEERRS
jgi:dihydroorotase